ncbi:protein of unknown function DUF214 [Fibrisoma limi BUZ 3]|uniref:Macrolide export ATP-binding/permease protein macB n=1 Tax=Fibrisoma limi BUZ 3 TaxID=1185876 RepID=I2GT36_9BACT|nr:ABC transporter permease [Fibrisoma limi]CCH57065.1 protein of unknown function DUF214 [Fibrisoma limi BUZ 3]
MFSNYLTVSLRNLWRNKAVSAISIAGLSVGLASGLVLFLLVNYMFSFDRYHPHMDRSYWIVTDVKQERTMETDAAPRPLADVLRRNYAFVESAVRLETFFGRTISVPDGRGRFLKKFNEARNICYTEPQYFDLFGVEWVSGNPKTALAAPNTIVISERYARKYFDNAPPMGRTLRLDNRTNLTVTGIIKDPPPNTQLRYDAFVSYATIPVLESKQALEDWKGLQAMCFVLLRDGVPAEQLSNAIPGIRRKYYSPNDAAIFDFHVLPLDELNHQRSGMAPRPISYALIAVGLLLVMAACINFVNLATAQALKRSKEVGVRKAIGSTRWQLIVQFLTETALLTLAAVMLALLLTQLCLPLVNRTLAEQVDMLNPTISILDLAKPKPLVWFSGLITLVILLAGLYPALLQARFNPTLALKGKLTTHQIGGLSIRRALIVVQFTLTQFFVLSVLVIMVQLRHMQQTDWGFRKESILAVWLPRDGLAQPHVLRDRWLRVAGVEQVSFCSDPPASPYNRPSPFSYHTHTQPESFETRVRAADENYVATFRLSLVAGRNFLSNDTTSREVLVNETLVRRLGVASPQEVIGKRMHVKDADRVIVGVVKDFRNGDTRAPVLPITLVYDLTHCQMATLAINPMHTETVGKAIEGTWNELLPEEVYRSRYISDLINSFYETERLLAGLVQALSLIAILIGCLGLYGLVTFMAESKTKEIGVRKVLGADTLQLLWLFGREFGKLLVLGFLIAAPLGWWLMSNWLQGYTYHIEIGWWLFASTIGLTVLTTVLTVSRQALKAAIANPVNSLRTD